MNNKHLTLLLAAAALFAALAISSITLGKKTVFYPKVMMEASETVRVGLIKEGYSTREQCETVVRAVKQTMVNFCPSCEILKAHCVETLTPRQQLLLDKLPIDLPVIRIKHGAITFESEDPKVAQQTCLEAARLSSGTLSCQIPDNAQLAVVLAAASLNQIEFNPDTLTLLKITLLNFLISFLLCGFLVWTEPWHSRFSHDAVQGGPQKFHHKAVPRIGGIAIALTIAATITGLDMLDILITDSVNGFVMLALSAIPAFVGGLAEDLTKKVGVLARLLLTMASGVIASVLIGTTLNRLDVPGLDNLLHYWPLFAIAFTAFAISGVANAVNIIDGYNGLASGFGVITLCAYSCVALQVGDQVVLIASLTMLGAVIGFLFWNWPAGKIFLGDGGAYLIGFWLAELGVLLVMRNPQVSPWFPLVIMIYPIWETLFSMYRRKIIRQHHVGHPDAMHLHQLVYQRLIRKSGATEAITKKHQRNSRVAPLLLIPVTLLMLPALLLWHRTDALLVCAGAFCFAYGWLYYRLAHWRAPRWLIQS